MAKTNFNDVAGALTGYFKVSSPYVSNMHIRSIPLAPALLAAVRAGTVKINQGTALGYPVAAPLDGAKILVGAETSSVPTWGVKSTLVVPGCFHAFISSDSPDVGEVGEVAVIDAAFFDAETDMIVYDTAATSLIAGSVLSMQEPDVDKAKSGGSDLATAYSIFGGFKVTDVSTPAGEGVAKVISVLSSNAVNPNASTGDRATLMVVRARWLGSAFGTTNI